MARPIKRLHGEPDVVKELRRRSRSTTIGVRDRERAEIILLRLDGVGVEAVAERLKTTPKRVSLWPGHFETLGLKGLDDKPGRGHKPSSPNANSVAIVPPSGVNVQRRLTRLPIGADMTITPCRRSCSCAEICGRNRSQGPSLHCYCFRDSEAS